MAGNKIINLVLLGPPGAGKGTQAKRLIERYPLVHLSSGDILRAERSAGTELGQAVKEYMDAGKLVPDELVTEVVINRIKKELTEGRGVLLDGFPRTERQAKDLDAELDKIDYKIDGVIDLDLPVELIVERMAGRRSCPQCGRVYHLQANPPEEDNLCDECKVELIQRPDDKEDVVRKRIDIYEEQTAPLREYYKNKGILYTVDASATIDEITENIIRIIDRLLEN